MEKNLKPNVIPTKEQMAAANAERIKKETFEAEKTAATNEIYIGPTTLSDTPLGHAEALSMMQERTNRQIEQNKVYGTVVEPELAESSVKINMEASRKRSEEQIEIRDAQLIKNQEQTKNYQRLAEEATNRTYTKQEPMTNQSYEGDYTPRPMASQPSVSQPIAVGPAPKAYDPYIMEISQPNYNSPFDVIPLPSKGKMYHTKKENVRVSYMTTADENILTSPNLLQSGEFLSILINRKILEPQLRYRDLLVGDRSAIMIWLRATGYGEMYPVTLFDNDGMAFDTEINLNDLKTKDLGAEPDEEGLFDYTFKLTGAQVKFRLLTCGDVEDIEKLLTWEKENGYLINNASTYTLEKMIVEVNGTRDINTIKDFVSSIRIKDGKDFNKYVEEIEPGIDLNITVGTPGGGSVDTFLPLNTQFFWPDFRI